MTIKLVFFKNVRLDDNHHMVETFHCLKDIVPVTGIFSDSSLQFEMYDICQ